MISYQSLDISQKLCKVAVMIWLIMCKFGDVWSSNSGVYEGERCTPHRFFLEARVVKFRVQVDYIKCWPWDDKCFPLMGMVSVMFNFGPNIFGTVEVRHLKFSLLIDTADC